MSRLIASILLSIMLFPVGAIVYLIVFFVFVETGAYGRAREQLGFFVAGIVTSSLIAWYWIWTWRQTVKWTPRRTSRTAYTGLASIGVGAFAGAATGLLDPGFGFFIGSVVPPLLWLVATVLVWRETHEERSARLRTIGRDGSGPGIPTCGYDMTGLKGTRCPECGSDFTVDELLAAQPERAAVELER
jgi:hypothetical protein